MNADAMVVGGFVSRYIESTCELVTNDAYGPICDNIRIIKLKSIFKKCFTVEHLCLCRHLYNLYLTAFFILYPVE